MKPLILAGHPDPAPDHCVDGGLPEAKHQVLAGEGNQGGHRGHHHRGRQQVQAIQGVDLNYWIYINGTMVLNQYIIVLDLVFPSPDGALRSPP